MLNCCIVLHTHSDYQDIWEVVFKRLERYGPNYKLYVLTNKEISFISKEQTILYNDIIPFSQRILLLHNLPYNYILFIRDSDILVKPTDNVKLKDVEETIEKFNIDSVRLNNSGVDDNDLYNLLENDCYFINNNCPYLFSLYPTIWKKQSLLQLMNEFKNYKYYDLECNEINNYCKKFNNCFLYNNESKIRQHNERYAHIIKFVHILQHGKWTYVHDPEYVMKIQNEFNIDLMKRGFHYSNYRRPSQTNPWNPYINI
jgi:hypothetical protein